MRHRPEIRVASLAQHRVAQASGVLAAVAALVAQSSAQSQFDELARRRMPPEQDSTTVVAIGDVDGDGDLDLILGGLAQNLLYLNDGTGTFTDATAGRMPSSVNQLNSLVLGDVDGDGDLDLLVGCLTSPPLTGRLQYLYLNDGTGRFTDQTTARLPAGNYLTNVLVMGDVDGMAISTSSSPEPWHCSSTSSST